VTGGALTVGLRVPDQPLALELLEAFAGGIAAPSANRFGRVSPTTAAHVRADLGTAVDLILDGGACAVGVESTIVDLSWGGPRVLRLGGLSVEAVSDVLGRPVVVSAVAGSAAAAVLGGTSGPTAAGEGPAEGVPAPGTLPSHYAPAARVEVLAAEDVAGRAGALLAEGRRVGLLAPRHLDGLPDGLDALPPAGRPQAYAKCLYQRLREADRRGLDVLLAVPPPATGIGAAVGDRLRRAASA